MNSTKLLCILLIFKFNALNSKKVHGHKPSDLCRNSINSDQECKLTNYTYVCANFFCSRDKKFCENFIDLKHIVGSIKSTSSYKNILLLLNINKKI